MDEIKRAIADGSACVSVTISAADLREIIAEIIADVRDKAADEAEAKRYLTRKEAMSMLGVSESTMVRWSNEGYLVPARIGAKCMYRTSDVYDLLQNKP